LFQRAGLDKCAVITSYAPNHRDIKGEETGEGQTEKLLKYEIYQRMIARYYNIREEEAHTRVSDFELEVKKKFVEEPAQMKLLIVVDKLLTGFDAPSATYLYIDKGMRDHGLFQAICRVNRLDGDDKEYGYIVDYKDLFRMLDKSIKDYTSGAFDNYDQADVAGLLEDRLTKARERLDDSLEAVKAMVEPVAPPKGQLEYLRYFVGPTENRLAVKETEPQRHAFYKAVSQLVRAYANLADEMEAAGYHPTTAVRIKAEVEHFQQAKDEVMLAADEKINLKQYEPGMRQLIDFYLDASNSRVLSQFEEIGLVELIVKEGEAFTKELPASYRNQPAAMAETIESNLRKVIIEESPTNPMYYERMSALLDEVIAFRKLQTQEYEAYLQQMVVLARQIKRPEESVAYPAAIQNAAQRALYENLAQNEELAVLMDKELRYVLKDNWRDHKIKQRKVRNKIEDLLKQQGIVTPDEIDRIFELVKNQPSY
jgi:type I restriction enzyme R subunit